MKNYISRTASAPHMIGLHVCATTPSTDISLISIVIKVLIISFPKYLKGIHLVNFAIIRYACNFGNLVFSPQILHNLNQILGIIDDLTLFFF